MKVVPSSIANMYSHAIYWPELVNFMQWDGDNLDALKGEHAALVCG